MENADQAHFAHSDNPWFARGGDNTNGIISGAFAFSVDSGFSFAHIGFRVVLNTIFYLWTEFEKSFLKIEIKTRGYSNIL